MDKQFGLTDQVIARIAQIVQESMMLGIDAVDLLRQIRMREDNPGSLVLTEEYRQQVKMMHDKLLADAERLAQASKSEEDEETASAFRLFKE